MAGCEKVPFSPSFKSQPSDAPSGDSPAGLHVGMSLPNKGLLNPKDGAVTETEPERVEITLPAGIAVNPSAANGIAACSLAQYRATTLTSEGCPPAAKVGTLTAHSPLLEEAVEGSVYLAAPRDNPSDSFLAIYIIARPVNAGSS